MKTASILVAALLFSGAAHAKEAGDNSAAPAPSSAAAPAAKPKQPQAEKPAHPTAADRKAYARKLAAELRRHAPRSSEHQGTATVRFTVGASGRVSSHKIVSSSDPALAPAIERILASIHAPPPPGGAFSAQQQFVFH